MLEAKYIIRLDDICPDMNWKNFNVVKNILLKHNVRPIIGVIPDNRDITLKEQTLDDNNESVNFWEMIKTLVHKFGWTVALHGFQHLYETTDAGMLGINKRSEFAGLPREDQEHKISSGMSIFEVNGVETQIFMAPSHSFDMNTLAALRKNGISTITDGFALWPYNRDRILFVPQLFSKPRKMPFGVYTFCLHINNFNEYDWNSLEQFIVNNKSCITSFEFANQYVEKNLFQFLANRLVFVLFKIFRTVRSK